uniref:CehA/McbA family metallohydrolase n=1 Tax=Ningiella ruwaisensis TaxID=2364274 RepID=UPI001F4F87AA|nr:CehA/McbA family metallohydrolase [Ningiella ruwaisensis]
MKKTANKINGIYFFIVAGFTLSIFQTGVHAQWTHQYSKLDDFGHHIYLEQHELPVFSHGVTDPAASPDGRHLAFASKGWIWLLDLQTGVATQLTQGSGQDSSQASDGESGKGPGIDSRPRWSNDGTKLSFVRDFGDDTAIVVKNLQNNAEQVINTPAIELDPEFSSTDTHLVYSSGQSGSVDLQLYDFKTNTSQALSELTQVERNARWLSGQNAFVYLHGEGPLRALRMRNLTDGSDILIHQQTLTYHLSSDTHPGLPLIVFSAPFDNDYHLWTMDLASPEVSNRLTPPGSFALTPSFSADGNTIYFVTLDEKRQFILMKMPTHGGEARRVEIRQWKYQVPTGQLNLKIASDNKRPAVMRVSITSEDGHPVANPEGASFIDSNTDRPYFYVDKSLSLRFPKGNYTVEAVQGPQTQVIRNTLSVKSGKVTELSLSPEPIWDAVSNGYLAADFHVHLNGDGHHRASHEDALLQMQGENLHMLSPQSWNRWERRIDQAIVGKISKAEGGNTAFWVQQGQEVRSHFHGHLGLINVSEPFYPWFFGPNNPVLGDPDLSNALVFEYANQTGAFATYVHPVSTDGDPFNEDNISTIPLELVSDGVLEDNMGLELVCAWTSPLGTAQLWYRFLNIGKPVVAMSGTDTWIDFHRTPAVGTGRAYVRLPDTSESSVDNIIQSALAGRSVLSTGPMIEFTIGNNSLPGDTVASGQQPYSINISSVNALSNVEVIVNGEIVATHAAAKAGATSNYEGKINLPENGWIAVRAYSESKNEDEWPSMHVRAFAHTSPVWINTVASVDPMARKQASLDLLKAIDASERRAKAAYGEQEMPILYKRFNKARERLNYYLE